MARSTSTARLARLRQPSASVMVSSERQVISGLMSTYVFLVQPEDDDFAKYAYLWGRQADAVGGVHDLDHAVDQLAQLVVDLDRPGFLLEHRIAELP